MNDNLINIKNGKVTAASTDSFEVKDNEIIVKDAVSEIVISKSDITGTKEVAGAELTLTSDKADFTKVLEVNTGLTAVEGGVKWTSGETAMTIKQLPDGTYTLSETAADTTNNTFTDADGVVYKVVESALTFEIENGEIKADSITSTEAKEV